jgi:hypothetical protein
MANFMLDFFVESASKVVHSMGEVVYILYL